MNKEDEEALAGHIAVTATNFADATSARDAMSDELTKKISEEKAARTEAVQTLSDATDNNFADATSARATMNADLIGKISTEEADRKDAIKSVEDAAQTRKDFVDGELKQIEADHKKDVEDINKAIADAISGELTQKEDFGYYSETADLVAGQSHSFTLAGEIKEEMCICFEAGIRVEVSCAFDEGSEQTVVSFDALSTRNGVKVAAYSVNFS